MTSSDSMAFEQLFRDASRKCFGYLPNASLGETECKQFSNEILEATGLVIGWKSIKNYSAYIFQDPKPKKENPSVATLDTLARYVLEAPYSDERERKEKASHFPFWFQYRENFFITHAGVKPTRKWPVKWLAIILASIILLIVIALAYLHKPKNEQFSDDFHSLSSDSLLARGWNLQSQDELFWTRRNERAGCLTLFTLAGDNWPDSLHYPDIKNLLLRNISGNCLTAEVHINNFIPGENWQQAGILLLEDTGFKGKSVRLSIAYNDYAGRLPKQKQVLIQAITYLGDRFPKPEETAHIPVFYPDSGGTNQLLADNLNQTSLRIEKKGTRLRLLYSGGISGNPAFKEIVSQEFDFNPRYVGLFALKGFVDSGSVIPAHFTFFNLVSGACDQ